MPMPGRQTVGGETYRYAFQGQEKDPETGKEAFELRLWDGRIGRWLRPDPEKQYPSPYLGIGNNPIIRIDPDGGCDDPPCDWLSDLINYFFGTGKANDQIARSQGANNLSDEDIELKHRDRLTNGLKGMEKAIKEDIKQNTSIQTELNTRVSYGSQYAGGVKGVGKVQAGGFALVLAEFNPRLTFNLEDGVTFDPGLYLIDPENGIKLIHRIGAESFYGANYTRVDTRINRKLVDTENNFSGTIGLLNAQTIISNHKTSVRAGVNSGISYGAFFVVDVDGGVYIDYTKKN